MQFKIKCSCGKSYQANESMIGRKFTCRNCQQRLEISAPAETRSVAPAAATEVLDIRCTCGKKYRVTEKHLGKRLKCAACGETIQLVKPQAATIEEPPTDDLFGSIAAAESAPAPPNLSIAQGNKREPSAERNDAEPVTTKAASRKQAKKQSIVTVLIIAVSVLSSIGVIVGLIFYSGILNPKPAAPANRPSAASAAAQPAAPPSPPPVPADDWAMVPEQIWTDQFAYVGPHAKLVADSVGLHASVDAPQNSLKLVHRHCLSGDFKMQIELQVQSQGQLNTPTGGPTFMGPQLVVGFIDAANARPTAMRIPLQPDQYSKRLSLTMERVGDQLSHNLGGPGSTATLKTPAQAGYVYFLQCVPSLITIEKVEYVGRKTGMGFETPNLQKLALDETTWGPVKTPIGTSPQPLSLVFGDNITIAPQKLGSFQYNLPIRGDFYLTGKVRVNQDPVILPVGRLPSVLQTEESPVVLYFQSNRSGFGPPVLIPIGRNETSFSLVRSGKHIASYCDGYYKSATQDEAGVFDTFGFQVQASAHTVELSDLQLYQSQ